MRIFLLYIIMLCAIVSARGEVVFDADFESGSIGDVTLVESGVGGDSTEFMHYNVVTKHDPPNPHDATAFRSSRWFYFRMCGVEGRRVALTINCNDSRRAMYSYDNVNYHRFSRDESPMFNGTIIKRYEQDSVFVAYYEPYTYARHQMKMGEWCADGGATRFSIGKSGEGREMEALVITNDLHPGLIPDERGQLNYTPADRAKSVVYIHGRIHPSETPSSWMLERVVDRLTSGGELLDEVIFYVIPFANPDGVVRGYSRTNAVGVDLEANFDSSSSQTAPEVANIKRFLGSLRRVEQIW